MKHGLNTDEVEADGVISTRLEIRVAFVTEGETGRPAFRGDSK